jgi:hypothetical protein
MYIKFVVPVFPAKIANNLKNRKRAESLLHVFLYINAPVLALARKLTRPPRHWLINLYLSKTITHCLIIEPLAKKKTFSDPAKKLILSLR